LCSSESFSKANRAAGTYQIMGSGMREAGQGSCSVILWEEPLTHPKSQRHVLFKVRPEGNSVYPSWKERECHLRNEKCLVCRKQDQESGGM
jgi:hypothetical protein